MPSDFATVAHQWPRVMTVRSRCHGRATMMGSTTKSKCKRKNNVIEVMLGKMEPATKTMKAAAGLDMVPVATAKGSAKLRQGGG
ncbi:hypothetical protein NL676_020698 [Syzygium grande]|nr:hypothetical protein NL676_020698 [Syzygium grande]